MADTPKIETPLLALDQERDNFRSALVQKGFSDDGTVLRGPIEWQHDSQTYTAVIDVTIEENFPFAPPKVVVVDAGADITPTFHIERAGNLCLWTSQESVHNAPWRDTDDLINKVAGWLQQTLVGWPDDDDADLERYLPSSDDILLYDNDAVEAGKFYRLSKGRFGVIRSGEALRWTPNPARAKIKGLRRRERELLWVIDVGVIDRPIKSWSDLVSVSGRDLTNIARLIGLGSVRSVLVRYQRGEREAGLVLRIKVDTNGYPAFESVESADTSTYTRTLRSGSEASKYTEKKVAIIGCGAIGSQLADLLFRSGVSHLSLIDPERLRPGNIIRHLADDSLVGWPKSVAVRAKLESLGISTTEVSAFDARVNTPKHAFELLDSHDLVIDATADARATALLRWAAEELDKHMISVCLQREGGIARVDRFPLWEGESHLVAVPIIPGQEQGYEMGCGSPVSKTPPMSVTKAAALGCQIALDDLNMWRTPPATIIEIIQPQTDSPYENTGILKSEEISDD